MKRIYFRKFFLFTLIFLLASVPSLYAEKQAFRLRAYQTLQKYSEDDVKAEIDFGRNLAARILGKYKLVKDEKLSRYVSLMGTGIVAQIGRPELQYYFAVIDTDDVNAYACPGGYIFITKGTLASMENEAQLAGVIAHEVVHVNQRHVVKKLKIVGKDKSLTSSFASVIGGTTASARALIDKLTNEAYLLLFEEGLDKKDEFESDTMAIQMITALEYDWKSYQDYIYGIAKKIQGGKAVVVSKTHPSISDRIANIKFVVQQNNLVNFTGKINQRRFNESVH